MFGESINTANLRRVVILLILAGFIAYQLRRYFTYRIVFLVTGFFMVGVILGELTRRLIRLFIKEKQPNPRIEIRDKPLFVEKEKRRDIEALNYGIVWYVVICLWLYF